MPRRYFFSLKMSRLVILLGPSFAALSGVAVGSAVDWALRAVVPAPESQWRAVRAYQSIQLPQTTREECD